MHGSKVTMLAAYLAGRCYATSSLCSMLIACRGNRSYTTSSPRCCAHRSVRVRFAPSPTGMMHLGGLRTALYNYIFAKSCGGKFILRIEDTDQLRLVEGAVKNIEQTLAWAGLHPDEGPNCAGDFGPYTQSARLDFYKKKIEILLQNGTAYRCFCSPQRLNLLRKEALRSRQVPRYDNRCRSLTADQVQQKMDAGEAHVIRFKLTEDVEIFEDLVYGKTKHEIHTVEGDPVLIKSDKYPTYHFANVVDDYLMGITHVLRGMEWLTSTSKHLLIYKAFDWKPPIYAHLPLLMNKDGSKLSKRQGDIFVEKFREFGYLPDALLNLITFCGSGFQDNKSIKDLHQLIQQFSIDRVSTHSATLDMDQLDRINRGHIGHKLMDEQQKHKLTEELAITIKKKLANRISCNKVLNLNQEYLLKVLQLRKNHINKLDDLVDDEYIWLEPKLLADHFTNTSQKAEAILSTVKADLQDCDSFEEDELSKRLTSISKQFTILKSGDFWTTLRLALSGMMDGPSVKQMFTILGKEESLRRLKVAVNLFKTNDT